MEKLFFNHWETVKRILKYMKRILDYGIFYQADVIIDLVGYIDSVDDTKDELFEKRKLLFDMSKKATKEQLDTFLVMFKAVIDEDNK